MIIQDIILLEVGAAQEEQPTRARQALPLDVYANVEHPSPPNKSQHGRISAIYVEVQSRD